KKQGPVALAAAGGSAQVVSELLRADIPYRTRDREGQTPLHHAARFGHISVLRVLVGEMRRDKNGGGGGGGRSGSGGGGENEQAALPGGDNTLMMDGGPFKLRSLDLSGRTAHATALAYDQRQAAAFLEAAEAELEPLKPKKDESSSSSSSSSKPKRRPGGVGGSSIPGGGKGGHPPRAGTASPTLRLAEASGSASGSGLGSGTSGRPSPVSSAGLGSGGSVVGSEDLSYEYCESDQE
ncbi:unnamed protein product, partial [Laminaria digitata]